MFTKLKKSIRLKWLQLQVTAAKELWQNKDPVQRLIFCAQKILANPDFELIPTMRQHVIFAPKTAKEFTEILAEVSESLDKNEKVSALFKLGPFRDQYPIQFLATPSGCIDRGNDHVLFHIAAIQRIANYINAGDQESIPYNRYNMRVLRPIVADFQLYVDSVLELYKKR